MCDRILLPGWERSTWQVWVCRRAASTPRSRGPAPPGLWREPSRGHGHLCRGRADSISGGAESVPGHHARTPRQGRDGTEQRALPGPDGHALAREAQQRALLFLLPADLAQHKPARPCRIPQPRSGPTSTFRWVLPRHTHHTHQQGHAGRCRNVPGSCSARGRRAVRQQHVSPSRCSQQQANRAVQRQQELYWLLNMYIYPQESPCDNFPGYTYTHATRCSEHRTQMNTPNLINV